MAASTIGLLELGVSNISSVGEAASAVPPSRWGRPLVCWCIVARGGAVLAQKTRSTGGSFCNGCRVAALLLLSCC